MAFRPGEIIKYGAVLIAVSFALFPSADAHGHSRYRELVHSGEAALSAGHGDAALSESRKAIALNPRGWEAYVVAGGALQTEGQYSQAIDEFTTALIHAPESKKKAIKRLMEQCVRAQVASQNKAAAHIGTPPSEQPSYADTVAWLSAHLAEAGEEAESTDSNGTDTTKVVVRLAVSDCRRITITWQFHSDIALTGNFDPGFQRNSSSDSISTFQFDLGHLSVSDWSNEGAVGLFAADGVGEWSFQYSDTFPNSHYDGGDSASGRLDDSLDVAAFKRHPGTAVASGPNGTVQLGTSIPFKRPGTENLPSQVTAAFQRLIAICKERGDQASSF